MYDLRIINGLVYKELEYHEMNLYITDGLISKISNELFEAKETYDADGLLVFPGVIDPHTHFELDLGTRTSKDDFKKGTEAAVFGGVTTIIDFLSPVNNNQDLEKEFNLRTVQAKDSLIDYKFHACVMNPKGNVETIVDTMSTLGLNTVKLFTTYSDSNRRTYDTEIIELLKLSKTNNFMVTAHIENDDQIIQKDNMTYHDLPISRPTISETSEALKLAQYARDTGGNLYMVHLSSGKTLKMLKEEYSDILNKNLIIESCPHYFVYDNSILQSKLGFLYTMAPPLRSSEEVTLLKNNIDSVYTIGTDHCTFDFKDKQKTLLKDMPLGVGGVEYSFDIMFSMFGIKVVDKMTQNVAKAHKLFPQKGIIQEGSDADLFLYKLKEKQLTENHSDTDHFIYKDFPVKGEVVSTMSNGIFVLKDRTLQSNTGTLLNKVVK